MILIMANVGHWLPRTKEQKYFKIKWKSLKKGDRKRIQYNP